jgi:hypothetical protein
MWIFYCSNPFHTQISGILVADAFGKPSSGFPTQLTPQILETIIKRAVWASIMLALGVSCYPDVHAGETGFYSFLCHMKAS